MVPRTGDIKICWPMQNKEKLSALNLETLFFWFGLQGPFVFFVVISNNCLIVFLINCNSKVFLTNNIANTTHFISALSSVTFHSVVFGLISLFQIILKFRGWWLKDISFFLQPTSTTISSSKPFIKVLNSWGPSVMPVESYSAPFNLMWFASKECKLSFDHYVYLIVTSLQ